MQILKLLFSAVSLMLLGACATGGEKPQSSEKKADPVTVSDKIGCYTTTDEANMFVQQPDLQAAPFEETGDRITLRIDPAQTYQTLLGFGASFTDSAAYLINQKLSDETRRTVMTALFDPEEGIGLSFLRNPMGASDFARTVYSYDDMAPGETDFELEHFSIDHDRADIIPLTKEAMALNPSLKLMASPWSPPGWMKTSGRMIEGALREDCYDVYGDYFIRFLEAYREEGIEFHAITPQNEPLYVPGHYPGCDMPAEAQTNFILQSLGPKLKASGFDTKLLCYDHNWDRPDYPETVLNRAGEYVDGTAWHVYGGEVTAQSQVVEAFPDKEVYFTEASGGEWVPPFEEAFIDEMANGINVLNHYSKCVILWNMALDENNGPTVPGFGQSTCRGIITVNQQTGEAVYNLDYYVLAHFSKFIRPGDVRVAAESKGSVLSTASLSADGKRLVVVFVNTGGARQIRFVVGDKAFDYDAPRKSAATFVLDLI